MLKTTYSLIRPFIHRRFQILIRSIVVRHKLPNYTNIWPIDPDSAKPPTGWSGWPEGKKFALVLTHDVESQKGLNNCHHLVNIEKKMGFRSSFNFVVEDYQTSQELRNLLIDDGFEVGIHGICHSENPFRNKKAFEKHAIKINHYLRKWGAKGFRSPCMYHNLHYSHALDVEYDASTFDTDPFEPQPDGMGTIFPMYIFDNISNHGYVELPYTLPQDFLLFILLKEKSIDIWKKKIDWIASKGGMALLITHPDYMNFGENGLKYDEYSAFLYEEILKYLKEKYSNQYCHLLPKDMAQFWAKNYSHEKRLSIRKKRVCMLAYTFYESDNRVRRYAEALARRGDQVDVVALRTKDSFAYEQISGVNVFKIQKRLIDEKGRLSYLIKLLRFFIKSAIFVTKRHLKNPYDLIHVHSVPDFEIFATLLPKLMGTKIILDIHDLVPEFYVSKFKEHKNIFYKILIAIEKASIKYSDHVIISNHIWEKKILSRSVNDGKCSVILNYPDQSIFYKRPQNRKDGKFIMLYPGTMGWHQGLDIAVKALATIKDEVSKVEFHIYGDGPERRSIERLIDDLGLQGIVFLKNSVPIDQIADVMADADLGIVPKRNDPFGGEAFSTKILEFMSLGIPVIVSATKIDKYYFNDAVVKFFKPEDESDLAKCMLEMINDKAIGKKLADNALQFIENFKWENRKIEYLDLVDSLLENNR